MRTAILILAALFLLTACATVKERVVLLPDQEGHVGQVNVRSGSQEMILDQAGQTAAISSPDAAPALEVMPQADIDARFSQALAAQPPAPATFVLYFETGGTQLTPESEALLPELIRTSHQRQPSEVSVVGHTDTKGSAEDNERLGLDRAQSIEALLLAKGIPADQISSLSHGEGNPLVPTDDNVDEPRNRRVEVTIR